MRIAVTGATGFLGRYLVADLADQGHQLNCWHRPSSDRTGLEPFADAIKWLPGELGDAEASRRLVEGCDALVHAGLFRAGKAFRGGEGDLVRFTEINVVGSIRLFEAAREAGVGRIVFISTGAVHEKIVEGRPLDETHPAWPKSHYGASKAAIEAFVHSYGFGQGYPIAALRPTGIYGLAHPAQVSKWFDLIRAVAREQEVHCKGGGKEVHAADVAKAARILLSADAIAGESYECYDQYISEYDVATLARELSGSKAEIRGEAPVPKNQIVTSKIQALGMRFGGRPLLERTIGEILEASR
ncbi:NAD-dependent epimerase/dehydratase family protein [Singulisphaera sp. PoT]|uniref:NAD-dependent epimerase/dehydratase family protein n=1 Tax=Singulisphaera sp. PoT TaxID=3411797 RepID=UPI003BF510AD